MNVELLEKAVEIISGIPDEKIELGLWQWALYQKGEREFMLPAIRHIDQAPKRLVCSPGGWLALHPDMQANGLIANDMGTPVLAHWRDHSDEDGDGYAPGASKFVKPVKGNAFTALAQTFDLKMWEATLLFGQRYLAERMLPITDKALWLARARKQLKRVKK